MLPARSFCAMRASLATGAGLATMLLAACAGAPPVDAGAACSALAAPLDAAAIGLPTKGAIVDSAQLIAASAEAPTQPLPFVPPPPEAVIVPAMPQYCKVLGHVVSVDAAAPPIRFEVNLPSDWNGRSLQYGGGGFNGVLITGLGLPPSARIDRPSPLFRGFVTYGTDSGHANAPGVPLQAFALNDEALENFAHASYKKVRDVAVALMKRRYGRGPDRLYFMGSSEGGREGITMAQRYPNDFDGILARVPVIGWTGLQAAGTRMGTTQMGGGWLTPANVQRVHDEVLAQCDRLDGLADGIVSDYEGCVHAFDASKLACVANTSAGSDACLGPAQIAAVRTLHATYDFPFPLANGVRSYPGWEYGGEANAGTGPVGGYVSWQTGTAPQALPVTPSSSRAWLYGSGAIQYFYLRDGAADPRDFKPQDHAAQVRKVSALMDSTDPDLAAFRAHGGKLVISEHLADYAQSPFAGIGYYRTVVDRMSQSTADDFLRLYVTPGADHVGTGAPVNVDMLDVLVDWVERQRAPGDLVQVAQNAAPPHAETASRPMCRYPGFPRFVGNLAEAGATLRAASFRCVAP